MIHIGEKWIDMLKKGIAKGLEVLPSVEKYFFIAIDTLFIPKLIMKQLIIISTLQIVIMLWNTTGYYSTELRMLLSSSRRMQRKIQRQMKDNASTYGEWKQLAEELDRLQGLDKWRADDESTLFDCRILSKRINDLVTMMKQGDVFNLIFRLRGGLARDQYGMQNEGLFSKAAAGTKHIVEAYHHCVSHALNFICDNDTGDGEVPVHAKLAFFNETRHAYGRTALMLSGGAYLGHYHMGVVRCLWSEGLLPRVISGSSAGSLVAGIFATKSDDELEDLLNNNSGDIGFETEFFKFSDTIKSPLGQRILDVLPNRLKFVGNAVLAFLFDGKVLNLDTEYFKRVVLSNVGSVTFQEAFDHTSRIVNITVAPLNPYDPPRLLNYLTAPHVCVWSACVASCSIPGIFDSCALLVKEPNGNFRPEHEWSRGNNDATGNVKIESSYSDGSLENDLPMQQLSELFNVNHFIVSQVNPHSAFLSGLSLKIPNASGWISPIYSGIVGYIKFLKAQCRDWLKNIVEVFSYGSDVAGWSIKRGLFQTLIQDYEGRSIDVTIMPWVGHISVFKAFSVAMRNIENKEYWEVVGAAEASTYPYISRIKAHCMVETILDKCVQRLRKRVSDENSVGLRDRKPSFFTSRSLVNFSGLSVADPNIMPDNNNYNLRAKSPSFEEDSMFLFDNDDDDKDFWAPTVVTQEVILEEFSSSSNSNNLSNNSILKRNPTPGIIYKIPDISAEPSIQPKKKSLRPNLRPLSRGQSPILLEIELERSNNNNNNNNNGLENNVKSQQEEEDNNEDEVRQSLTTPSHKSINMANFYYKNQSKSDETLNNKIQ